MIEIVKSRLKGNQKLNPILYEISELYFRIFYIILSIFSLKFFSMYIIKFLKILVGLLDLRKLGNIDTFLRKFKEISIHYIKNKVINMQTYKNEKDN